MSTVNSDTNYLSIEISENLKQSVLEHINYLKEFHEHPELLADQARAYAIYRYEKFWLPFIFENQELDNILPPIDIHLVWHTHLLAPLIYATDCEQVLGRLVNAKIRQKNPQSLKYSEQLWLKKYQKSMPYNIDYTTVIPPVPTYTSKIKYNLHNAVERQVGFYYNVALDHYKDEKFLNDALLRYKKFIYLKKINPQLFVVPMYDIDLIWHTHQLHPESYKRDMIKNLNQVLHHDDSTQDRTVNSKLHIADHDTRHKWEELYGEKLPKNGCMYRGKSSKNLYNEVTDFSFLLECQRYSMYVQFSTVSSNDVALPLLLPSATKLKPITSTEKSSTAENVNTIVSLTDPLQTQPLPQQIFAQINLSEQELFARGSSGLIEAHFEADYSDLKTDLKLKIQQRSGYWPMNYFTSVQEFDIGEPIKITTPNDIVEPSDKATADNNPNALFHLFESNIENELKMQELVPHAKRLIVGIPAVEINTIIVSFESSAYDEVTLKDNYPTQLGTTFLFNLENVKVKQALHEIHPCHQKDPLLLNIRHTIVNGCDIFTAFYHTEIYASCHTLNWSQLPLPTDVQAIKDVITLDPQTEEALIIKDHNGDWGIVKYNTALFIDTQEIRSSLSSTLSPESFQFYLYRFTAKGVEKEAIFFDWEDEKWSIGSDNFGIDMNTWSISLKRSSLRECMQYFCLCSALIIRFDTLFNEIFGQQLNGVEEHGNDLLSNETNLERLSIDGSNNNEKKPTMVISSV